MVTDPPYGVSYDPKWRDDLGIYWTGQAQRRSTHPGAKPISSRSLGKVPGDDKADWSEAWALFPGHIAYVWHGGLHAAVVEGSLVAAGFAIRSQIIWVKQHFVFSRGDYHWQHEPCWYAVRGTGEWRGDRKQTTVWQIANASAFRGAKDDVSSKHGTQKPVECMRQPIENNSSPGQAVYRSVYRERVDDHRRGTDRTGLPLFGDLSRLRGRQRQALAEFHRRTS
jgi:DNA modification methylase